MLWSVCVCGWGGGGHLPPVSVAVPHGHVRPPPPPPYWCEFTFSHHHNSGFFLILLQKMAPFP